MSADNSKIALRGSNRLAAPNSTRLAKADPNSRIRISIFARRNPAPPTEALAKNAALAAQPIGQRRYLTQVEFDQVFGAAPADMAAIARFAEAANLSVIDSNLSKRRVLVEGALADVEKAFGVELNEFDHPDLGRYRGREGEVYVPRELYGVIDGVEGLDTRPAGRPRRVRSHFAPSALAKKKAGGFVNKWPGTFFPPQVAGLYDYPTEFDGAGQNLAIFAFNGPSAAQQGGYNASALQTYFTTVLKGVAPKIADVVVQGPGNDPGPDTAASARKGDATGEVMLDLCVAGSVAPGANIFVYFTEFSTQGWIEAITEAINGANNISVMSISYGNPEDDPNSAWTLSGIQLVNTAFQSAAAKGITICCASGDDGSTDQAANGAHADFPASSPWVLGVGGTTLRATQGVDPQIASETVWNDLPNSGAGGGGVSAVFPLPSYQNGAGVPASTNPPHKIGRGVPDVAAVADPYTGVVIMHVNGKQLEPVGGTSAAAPIWASLLVRINQGLGSRVGFLNPTLYASCATGVLNDITVGDNGAYAAGPGWDACTGLGSPDGNKLLHALKNAPAPPA